MAPCSSPEGTGEETNHGLLRSLLAAGVPQEEIALLERAIPREALEYFHPLDPALIGRLLEALLLVHTLVEFGEGEGAEARVCPSGCAHLVLAGLLSCVQDGERERLRTTPAGVLLAHAIAKARISKALSSGSAACFHPLIPILLAGRYRNERLILNFPAVQDEVRDLPPDLPSILSPETFERFREFCRALERAGCAFSVVQRGGAYHAFLPEFPFLLKGLLEQMPREEYLAWSARAVELEEGLRLLAEAGRGAAHRIASEGSSPEALIRKLDEHLLKTAHGEGAVESAGSGEDSAEDREECSIGLREMSAPPCRELGPLTAGPSPVASGPVPAPSRPAMLHSHAPRSGVNPGELRVFLGYSEGEEVCWEPAQLNNGHFIIIGGSGAGKTETIRVIASELDHQDYPVLMIDFHGDMAMEGARIATCRIREGGEFYFNPLELDPLFRDITPLRATSDFVDALSINFPTLGIQQRRRIREIVKEAYWRHRITSEPATWSRVLPFETVEDGIMRAGDETLPAYLEDVFDYRLFSGTRKLSAQEILRGHVTHLHLSALPESLRYLFADLFLRRLFYSLQALGEIPRGRTDARSRFRLFVIVDEAKLLVSQKAGQKQVIKAVLNKYVTEMRKFGVGLILASQLVSHFNDEILANIAVKFCMRTENRKQALENSRYFEISEEDLMNFRPGEGILSIGSRKVRLEVLPISRRGTRF